MPLGSMGEDRNVRSKPRSAGCGVASFGANAVALRQHWPQDGTPLCSVPDYKRQVSEQRSEASRLCSRAETLHFAQDDFCAIVPFHSPQDYARPVRKGSLSATNWGLAPMTVIWYNTIGGPVQPALLRSPDLQQPRG